MQNKQQQLDRVNNLGNALKHLSLRGIVPEIVHYSEYHQSAISISFEDLKAIAAGQPVTKTVDTMITYQYEWLGVRLMCTVFENQGQSEQVKL